MALFAGNAFRDRKQAGSLFYIDLRRVKRHRALRRACGDGSRMVSG
jgi:hypothetical protein